VAFIEYRKCSFEVPHKIITTMKEAKASRLRAHPFEEEHADEGARKILEQAISNFRNREKYLSSEGRTE